MFELIKHKLNQSRMNHSNIIRQIGTIDENILNPLTVNSHEGIYGFESLRFNGEDEFFTLAPSDYIGVDGTETILDYDMFNKSINHLHCYSVELAYPYFVPIQTQESPLWDDLFALNFPNVNLFTQFLIYQGQNNWKERFYDQYESYLSGNNYPSDIKLGRSLQKKILTIIDKVSGAESGRKRIPQIERKLFDDGYRVSFRLMLHSESDDNVRIVEREIQDILSTRNYFNELVLIRHQNKEAYLEQYVNRMVNVKYAPVLSETELFSLFMEVDGEENINVNSKPSNVKDNIESKKLHSQVDLLHSASGILPESNDNSYVIYLKSILENNEFKNYAKEHPLPFCFGTRDNGELLLGDLTQLKHLLVAASTGFGKSYFLNQLILTLLLQTQPNELEMYLIDPKFVEFEGFNGFPHVQDVIIDMNKVTPLLDKLIDEMDKRYEFLRSKRYKSMVKYNQDHPKQKKPFIVCVVDEYADLKMTNPEVDEYVQRLGQKARAAGIHLICATQRPDATVISGIIKANLPTKVVFRIGSKTDERTVFGKGQPFNLINPGDGVVKMEGQLEEFIQFKSPVITLDEGEEEAILDQLKELFNGERVDKKVEAENVNDDTDEEPLDKLKNIIASTNETRIRILQNKMNISINKIQSMMKELVDEGFLVQDGRSYRVKE